jgi:hypothetical protein
MNSLQTWAASHPKEGNGFDMLALAKVTFLVLRFPIHRLTMPHHNSTGRRAILSASNRFDADDGKLYASEAQSESRVLPIVLIVA